MVRLGPDCGDGQFDEANCFEAKVLSCEDRDGSFAVTLSQPFDGPSDDKLCVKASKRRVVFWFV